VDVVPLDEEANDRGVLQDARAGRARGAREALRGLDGIAVARGRLIAPRHEVVGTQAGLDLEHVRRRDEPGIDPDGTLERDGSLHGRAHPVVHPEQVSRVAEAARFTPRALGEVLEEVEGVPDHPAGLGGGVVLSHARRALARAPGGDRPLVDDGHVPDPAARQVIRGARPGHPTPDDDHLGRLRVAHPRDANQRGPRPQWAFRRRPTGRTDILV
jgi:hypothetical protein